MKNKIISIIFIILLITSCRKSRDITGGGNNGGNNGNSRLTKDNYEPPQTNTDNAKNFLKKFQEMKAKYPKGELMAYYRDISIIISIIIQIFSCIHPLICIRFYYFCYNICLKNRSIKCTFF